MDLVDPTGDLLGSTPALRGGDNEPNGRHQLGSGGCSVGSARGACDSTTCAIRREPDVLASGADLRTVMGRLGHSQIGITANLYTHLLPQVKQDAAERIDRLFAERS